MNATVRIDLSTPQAVSLVNYLETLPFAEVEVEKEKKSFAEAAKECNAVPLETFIDELRCRINEHYDKLENA